MKDQHKLEAVVKDWLDEIKPVSPRNPQAASRGRAQFLSQAVSEQALPRQKRWISIFRKERYAMNVLLSVLVVAGLMFGGGATVSAAQGELPNEPLYAVKTWTEDLSLRFSNNSEDKVNRLMELSQIRIQEMIALAETGEIVPDQTRLRLEQHIQQALQICTTMDDTTLERTLLHIRDQLQQQDRDMEQLQLHTQDQTQLLTQVRTMLQERLQLVDEGLLNHEMFRNQVQNGFQYGQDDELTPPVQEGNGEQNGQPTLTPIHGPNTEPGNQNTDTGGPNTDSGSPNTNPGSPNPDSGNNSNGSGNGSGGDNSNSNGSGGGGNK